MINREIPFRPRLEGEFRVRFYNAASEITEKTPTLTIARIAEREIEWVEKDCQYNIEQRKKYRAVWFLFRDLIRASWKACYRNGVIYMSLPTLNGTDMHDTTSPEVKALLRSWMSESRHERLVGYTDFINRMENPGTNKQSIAALIADGDELEKRIKRVHTGEIAIEAAVQPYLQLVRENDRDVFTGLKTSEIWRYFRLTWSTPVETTPGRTMQYLIRDAAHPMHAVMGIASLENCAVQITCRDDYIGWNQKAFIERIVTVDNDRAKEEFKQLLVYLEDGIDGIDYSELCTAMVVKNPTDTDIQRIAQAGRSRGIHLVICTQRPEAKLVPSTTKAQLNGRVALRVNDGISSRMIIEEPDAQYLQKHGDMIYRNGDIIERAQGYLIEIEELDKIVDDVIHGRI